MSNELERYPTGCVLCAMAAYMWHDAPCFLLSTRGSAWKAGSNCSDRLPRRLVDILPYGVEDDDDDVGTADAADEWSSVKGESE